MDNVNLLGSEDVLRASHNMQSAAETMSQAASSIDHSNEMFLRRFEELVCRLEEANKPIKEPSSISFREWVTRAVERSKL